MECLHTAGTVRLFRTLCACFFVFAIARPTAAQGATVVAGATVFSRPSEQSAVVATLDAATPVEIHATVTDDPNWAKVTLPGVFPRVGYVERRYITPPGGQRVVDQRPVMSATAVRPEAPVSAGPSRQEPP